jgi:hypothetical protein
MADLLRAMAWSILVFAAVVWLAVLVDRFLAFRLPGWQIWFWASLGVTLSATAGLVLWRRPSRHQAAIAIDERLGLKEKFSTALYVRPSSDPFAAAAVRDAEATADNVSLQKRFPVQVPVMMVGTCAMVLVAALTAWLLGPHYLFGDKDPAAKAKQAKVEEQRVAAKKSLEKAILAIDNADPAIAKSPEIVAARASLTKEYSRPIKDPAVAQRSALKAMQDMEAIKKKVEDIRQKAIAHNEMQPFKSMGKPSDPNTPIGQAQASLQEGKFTEAIKHLDEAAKKFEQMKKEDQQKAADQMKNMAQQLQQLAGDKNKQQQAANQLQQMGANQQQMQQLANAVQAAANGDKQAQQQVQQMANQIAQQLNQQQGMNPQQQQQQAQAVQNAIQQMQQAANNQAAAQQMAQAAQQMAQAMQQAAQGQQAGQQQGQAKAGQQGQGQPNPNAANPQGQGQGNQQGQQGMAQAQQQMMQQLQKIQQAADDAAEVAAQQAMGQGQGDGQDGQPGDGDNGANGRNAQANGQGNQGEFEKGEADQIGQGSGGPGISAGGPRPKGIETPVGFKGERSPTHTNKDGKILASSFVKALSEKGESRLKQAEVIEAQEKESTDEVEQDRIPRPAQKAVKSYFDDLKEGLKEKP